MKKFFGIVMAAMVAVCGFAMAACGAKPLTLDAIKEKGTLVVATNAQFKPFEYMDGNNIVGIDIDMAQYICDKLSDKVGKEIELVIQDMEFDSVVTSTKNSTDIAMAGLTVDETRAKTVDFSEAYYDATQLLVVAKNDTTFDAFDSADEIVAKINELGAQAKIGYQNGTTGQIYANGDSDWEYDGFADAVKKGYTSAALAVSDIKNGSINMVIVDEEPAKAIVAANPDAYKLIDIVLTTEQYAVGIRKGSTELVEFVNQCLHDMQEDGTYESILAKYIKD